MKIPDFSQAPLLVIWEVTRACSLVCRHCRASAEDIRSPLELSLDEGKALVDQVADLGTPLLVFTGGDPLQRSDLEDLVRHGKARGLTVATIPAATDRLTRDRVFSLKEAGIDQLALSLDGISAIKHDGFRQVEGTFDRVIQAAGWIKEAGVPLQINSVLGDWNRRDFPALAALVESLGTVFWEIFFLVPTGRGAELDSNTAAEFESLFAQIHALDQGKKMKIKVTEAQHYRRYYRQHQGSDPQGSSRYLAGKPVNAGNGFCFIDHQGAIQPSGFPPLDCGNIRNRTLAEVYQNHRVFRELRDFSLVKGPCAACSYLSDCSAGSRARTYALTGDYLGSEKFCVEAVQPEA